jgi:hypothetical protein|tara:strand:- start:1150 stop:1371 length:222 start_codon:yes stop_codon:yes gene_type:complete
MYNTIESFINHHGWTKTSRVDYIANKHIIEGKSKDQIKKVAVDKYGIFPNERSFNNVWNFVERISNDIKWVHK